MDERYNFDALDGIGDFAVRFMIFIWQSIPFFYLLFPRQNG